MKVIYKIEALLTWLTRWTERK